MMLLRVWAVAKREAGRNNRRLGLFQVLALVFVPALLLRGVGLFAFGTCWSPSGSRSGNEYDADSGELLLHTWQPSGERPDRGRQDGVRYRDGAAAYSITRSTISLGMKPDAVEI